MKQLKLTFLFTVLMSMVGTESFAYDIAETNDNGVTIYYNNHRGELEVVGLNIGFLYTYSFDLVIPEYVYDGVEYPVTKIGESAFDGYTGLTSIEIPNSVTSIGSSAFRDCSGLTSIEIPSSVTTIGDYAFSGCSGLTSIEIPNSVTSIGDCVFENCSGLTSVTIPGGVTNIGGNVFRDCSGLTSVNVLVTDFSAFCNNKVVFEVSNIGKQVYLIDKNGNEIKEYVIPDDVTSIGSSAFRDCTGLTSVTIPNSVTTIGGAAFSGCSGLTSIEIPNSVTTIGGAAFSSCSGLTSIEIPNSMTSIGDYAFYYCSGLTSIEIPNSVTSIGEGAFYGCSGLTSINVQSGNTNYDSRNNCNAIIETSSNTLIFGSNATIIPNSVTSIGKSAFSGCSGLTSIEIPNSVTSIGERAFFFCTNLTSITIPNSVTSIGSLAFSVTAWYDNQSDGLVYVGKVAYGYRGTMPDNTSIAIKEGTLEIGDWAFQGCTGLTSIEIPNSVTTIGGVAFSGCSGLTTIEIPNSVTSIGNAAFRDCSGLKKVIVKDIASWCSIKFSSSVANPLYYAHHIYSDENTEITDLIIPNSVTSIGKSAFLYCSGLTSIEIPNSVTSIGEGAFSGCSGLKKVIVKDIASWCSIKFSSSDTNPLYYAHHIYSDENTEITDLIIPNSVTSIGSVAFYGCTGLTSIEIPNSVTTIGGAAFSGCSGLTTIEIPNSVTSIGNAAFRDCSGLTSIEIPNSVSTIGDYAFSGCSGLTSITIPNSVTSIGNSAFSGCSGLTSITIPNSVSTIGDYAFSGCSGLTSITIPNSVTSIGSGAFSGCIYLTSVIVELETPLTISYTFSNYYNATLYVPRGSKAAYETAAVWKEFKEIIEVDPVTITAKDYTIEYGDDLPTFEFTSEGTTLEGTPTITCEVTKTSPVGTYPIVISKGSVTNYNDTYVNGTLTITKAPLTITAKDYTVKQCDELPTFEAEYEGFKNNETEDVLIAKPILTTTTTSTNIPGEYTITVSGAEAENYEITCVAGKLTIEKLSFEQTIPTGQQWQTFISEMPCKLSEGSHAKVYAVSSIDNENVYVEEYPDGIPANCMVLVGLDSNPEEPTAITFDYYEQASSIPNLLMGGGSETTGLTPYRTYVLYNDEFVLNSGSSVAAGIGYLTKQSADARENLNIVIDGETTSVRKPVSVPDNTDAWYDLNGRKLSGYPTKKGIYLNNNKKIVIK